MTGFLKEDVFALVVESTPLISMDLIVKSKTNKILLGKRLNRPAQNFWFVPGGRIFKNEKLDQAFSRIALDELGLDIKQHEVDFLGVFQHFYEDSQFGMKLKDPSTHYVVLGYEIGLEGEDLSMLPQKQHHTYQWWDIMDLMNSNDVHQHTKDYFLNHKNI
jgi:colanic acid biosynthesis protein WcaH